MTCTDLVSYSNDADLQKRPYLTEPVRPIDESSGDAMTLTLASLSWPQWRAGSCELSTPWGLAIPEGRISFYLWRRGTGYLVSPLYPTPVLLRPGDVVLLPGAHAHSLRVEVNAADQSFDATVRLAPQPNLSTGEPNAAFAYGHLAVSDMGFNPLQGKLPSALHIPGDHEELSTEWRSVLQLIDLEQDRQRPGWNAIVRQLIRILFHQVIRSHLLNNTNSPAASSDGTAAAHSSDPAIRLVVGLLHAELGKPWTVTSLAKWIHMSRSAFSARFREVVGQPPLQYLTEVRMQRACELLCESNLGIKQIATVVGYESPSSFTNAFKRWRGVSPIAYRLRHHPELVTGEADGDGDSDSDEE